MEKRHKVNSTQQSLRERIEKHALFHHENSDLEASGQTRMIKSFKRYSNILDEGLLTLALEHSK